MLIKGIKDEDFVNYKKTSMFIIFPKCDFKCDREASCSICQNSSLAHEPNFEIEPKEIVERYMQNPITKAIVLGGLEPFDSLIDLSVLIEEFRKCTNDDIVIYTGYTEKEINSSPIKLGVYKYLKSHCPNVIIKFGRFVPNQEPHYDEVLGVKLASNNQYARRIS